MPLTVHVDAAARLVLGEGSGVLCFDDVVKALSGMFEDPDFEPDFRQLCDLSAVTGTSLTSEEVRSLAERVVAEAARFSSVRLAIVAPEPLIFGLSRMYEMLTAEISGKLGVFRTRPEAVVWLDSE